MKNDALAAVDDDNDGGKKNTKGPSFSIKVPMVWPRKERLLLKNTIWYTSKYVNVGVSFPK